MSKGKDQLKNEKKFKILKKRASKNIQVHYSVQHRDLPTNTIDEILKACLIIERKAVFAF